MRRFRKLLLRVFFSGGFRRARHHLFMKMAEAQVSRSPKPRAGTRVLVLGVYLADRENSAAHLSERLATDAGLIVVQRWAALGGSSDDPYLRPATRIIVAAPEPKFALINLMLRPDDVEAFDFIVACDDDIFIPTNFLSAFIGYQQALGFAMAQPSRAWHSFFDHEFVLRRPWLEARETRFVECGPLVSFRKDAARLLLPFQGAEQMWGQDFVWPEVLERNGLTMGIVDALSIDHSLRDQATTYDRAEEREAMNAFLATTPHLTKDEALTVRKSHKISRQ